MVACVVHLFPLFLEKLGAGDLGHDLLTNMFAWLRSVGRGRGFGSSFLALWNVFFESRDGVETAFLGKLSPLPVVMFAMAWIRWRRKALARLLADMGIEYIVVNHDNLEAIESVAGGKRQGSYGKKHLAGIAIIKQLLAEYCHEEYRHQRVAVYRIMDRPPAR